MVTNSAVRSLRFQCYIYSSLGDFYICRLCGNDHNSMTKLTSIVPSSFYTGYQSMLDFDHTFTHGPTVVVTRHLVAS